MPTYTALTIGPIYKTFSNVRKTREVWGASYMFSNLVKNIILKLKDKKFIVPYVDAEGAVFETRAVGLFPDRFIFESDGNGYAQTLAAYEEVLSQFAEENGLPREFLKEYLRCFVVEKEFEEGLNVIKEMTKHLDTLELQNKPLPDNWSDETAIFDFLRNIHKRPLFRNYVGSKDTGGAKRFESLVEISTRDLKVSQPAVYEKAFNQLWEDENDVDNDEGFLNAFSAHADEKVRDSFKTYHKYIAIIKADGDKIGATIEAIYGRPDARALVGRFSQVLFNWAKAADKAIRNYGGVPIYIGGDDLLAFVPVANGKNNVASLIDDIDAAFESAMADIKKDTGKNPSLSYGVSISYYKFPLFEALNKADTLLHEAKNFSPERNTVCIGVLKHSGSELKTILTKKTGGSFTHFKNVTGHITNEKSFLNSVMYNLRENEALLEIIGHQPDRFSNFLENNFEDYRRDGQKRNANGEYLDAIGKFLPDEFLAARATAELALEPLAKKKVTEKALNHVYSALRIARFIKGLDDDK